MTFELKQLFLTEFGGFWWVFVHYFWVETAVFEGISRVLVIWRVLVSVCPWLLSLKNCFWSTLEGLASVCLRLLNQNNCFWRNFEGLSNWGRVGRCLSLKIGFGFSTLVFQILIFNFRFLIFDFQFLVFKFRFLIFKFGISNFNFGFLIFNFGFSILDLWFCILVVV